MEVINETNNNVNTNNTNGKKKIKLHPIKLRMKKSESQPNLLNNKKNRILSSIHPIKNEINNNIKNKMEKKLFNNANDYQFLYKDIRNTHFVVLWVKYLRNYLYSPGPVQHLGFSAPSFYEKDLELFRKRFNDKNKKLKSVNKSVDIFEKKEKWKNLNMSNESRNNRYNEYLPHIIDRNDRYLDNENKLSDKNSAMSLKSRYLHPFKYNFRKVTMDNGNVIKQRYLKYDDEKTLKSPSLLFSSNKYNDKCNIKNFNSVKEYLNMANAFDFVKWQSKLRTYEKPIK